ncbi:HET-domain-containing protein [Acephala macrosclerotiorum]|nr:HET-domain-containing protein [Acephala macrosclerotiorum]
MESCYTSTPDKISTAKSWLHDCELKHQKCKPPVTQMPKRLIEVGLLGGRPPGLIMSEDLHNLGTTRENENSYRTEITYQLLPPTLQDALTLTRHLHIQFLWIDALRIVQDDHAEWGFEASRMQDIYSGSSVTIAATDAANASAGCISPDSGPDRNLNKTSAFLAISNTRGSSGAIVRVPLSPFLA